MVGFELSLAFLLLFLVSIAEARDAHINGTLTCQGHDLHDEHKVRLEIWDEDRFSADDKLSEVIAHPNGTYDLWGKDAYEWWSRISIKPCTILYHKCGGACRVIYFQGQVYNPGNYELFKNGLPSKLCEKARYDDPEV
ncbi:unnamed protein product [Bursaphelenchus xylophilus]|uniref:(pine wood nematode) hypothetical protein n=1 Tax=Bursaphelenchus xylophilus TaxID=6326 RepID=A0A1I7SL32_BURXY|nr:unnamed protein product [Bursaphelenchus xylophilus]CAG9129351.1 unnamed protein product [Bursaphelenchus xylophilus]